MLGANAANEPDLFHPIDDPGQAALAVEDSFGKLVHRNALWRLLEVDQDVVPPLRNSYCVLEFRVEHVEQREGTLEE